ncbi:MAG: hypothetical protein AAGG50_04560 [Bacteroidota bacterium]
MRLLGLCLFLYVCALPTLKNVALWLTYEHGREALERVAGEPGALAGVWEGAFDFIPCGTDSHGVYRLTIGDDEQAGVLSIRWPRRHFGVVGYGYSWASLMPYDHESGFTETYPVQVEESTLVVKGGEFGPEFIAFQRWGDRLRVRYVAERGTLPTTWGFGFRHRPHWYHLFDWWGRPDYAQL